MLDASCETESGLDQQGFQISNRFVLTFVKDTLRVVICQFWETRLEQIFLHSNGHMLILLTFVKTKRLNKDCLSHFLNSTTSQGC